MKDLLFPNKSDPSLSHKSHGPEQTATMQLACNTSEPIVDDVARNLQTWFGDCAGVSVCIIDGSCSSLPEEENYIHSAIPSRRKEFLTGRWCARTALAQLGLQPSPIAIGSRGQPLWPAVIVGSITHAGRIAAAVVQWEAESCRGIGIDLIEKETAAQALSESAGLIASADEERKANSASGGQVDGRALAFSIKESVIKAVSPSVRRLLDFREIEIRVGSGYFESVCLAEGFSIRGRWQALGGFVLTAGIAIKASQPRAVGNSMVADDWQMVHFPLHDSRSNAVGMGDAAHNRGGP